MTYFKLEKEYSYKLVSMPRGKKYIGSISNSCNRPKQSVSIDSNGNCLLCICDGWLPIPVGQVQDFKNLKELFSSPIATLIQDDVDNKKFTWCAVDHCGVKNQNIIQNEFLLSINIDESCNLWCSSCRRDPIMHLTGEEFEKKKSDVAHILKWLDQCNDPITIELSGNGDPLASAIIRPLFQHYKSKPSQKFLLKTNGLLIKKQLLKSSMLENIKQYSISIDAGSAEVYEKVRCGGSWPVLLENFDFLVSLGKEKSVNLNFAVQKSNFKDIPNFVNLCNRYGFHGNIHQLDDWGTWNNDDVTNPDEWTIKNGTFIQHNVLDKQHPEYQECKQIVESIRPTKNVNLAPRLMQLLEIK